MSENPPSSTQSSVFSEPPASTGAAALSQQINGWFIVLIIGVVVNFMVLLWPQPQPTVSLQVPALPTPLNPKHVPVLIKAQRPDRSQVFVLKEPDEVTFEGGHSQTKAGKVLSQWSGHKRRRSGSHHSSKKVMPPPHSISINQAGPSDLKRLPGIGDAMAQRIIQDRQANGPFPSLPDLQRVKGIGPKKFEKMAPYLKL